MTTLDSHAGMSCPASSAQIAAPASPDPAPDAAAAHVTISTPTGPFTAVVDDSGAVLASGWTDDVESLLPSIHRTLRPVSSRWSDSLSTVTDAVEAYYAGQLSAIDAVSVRQRSGPYMEKVWEALRQVEAGNPRSFAQLAEAAGHPTAIRATAAACTRNAVTLFVPCHRVLRQDGTVAGFRYGKALKQWLLTYETAGFRHSDRIRRPSRSPHALTCDDAVPPKHVGIDRHHQGMLFVSLALFVGLLLGAVVGWLANASRSAAAVSAARTEADALRTSQELAARSLSAASEDAARRQSTAIGCQVNHIVEPLRGVLGQLSEELRRVEHNRISAYSGLAEQVRGMHTASQQLSHETRALANALHTPHVRGRWGELQLERVVELAGMSQHCDFSTQVSAESEASGQVRPDMVIHLAGDRSIVVDAKVPLHAYLAASDSDDPDKQAAHLDTHARAVRTHIAQLASKSYWTAFANTPEMVVLFVPGDAILDAAVRADPGLIEYGFTRNVVLTTPTSLIALLRTVALGWRHDALAADAATIRELGVELHHRLASLLGHLDKMGISLRRAVESFNSTLGVVDSRVGVTARKLASLESLGVVSEPAQPSSIDVGVRSTPGTVGSPSDSTSRIPDEPDARATSTSG